VSHDVSTAIGVGLVLQQVFWGRQKRIANYYIPTIFRFSKRKDVIMPKFVIERDIPGAGKLASKELQGVAQKSCTVLRDLGPQIQWVHSYVTDDKIYCVYNAPSENLIRKHAQMGGFPANRISRVRNIIDPTTAE